MPQQVKPYIKFMFEAQMEVDNGLQTAMVAVMFDV